MMLLKGPSGLGPGGVLVFLLLPLVSHGRTPAPSSTGVEQIHLAYGPSNPETGGYPSGVVVSWVTRNFSRSVVWFGLSPQELEWRVQGPGPSQYGTTSTPHHHQQPQQRGGRSVVPGASWNHHVTLNGLKPATTYYYACGDDDDGGAGGLKSEVLSFVTAKTSSIMEEAEAGGGGTGGQQQQQLSVAVFGDMGLHNANHTKAALAKALQQGRYDFIWHVGDISYADDAYLERPWLGFKYEDWWDDYQQSTQPFAARAPVMVLPGNHEAECRSPYCQAHQDVLAALGNFSAYNARFRMPSQSSGGALNMWYSFNVGPVHWVCLNTETDYPGAPNDKFTLGGVGNGGFGDQLAWLERDLQQAASERGVRPWVLVGGHRPMYTAQMCDMAVDGCRAPTGYSATVQAAFENLLLKYGVDMYFAGHVHAYERHWPVFSGLAYRSYDDPPFPVHVISGAAGNIEGLSSYPGDPSPPWGVVRLNDSYGYGILDVHNATTITWSYYDSKTMRLRDQFVLRKTRSSSSSSSRRASSSIVPEDSE